MNMKRVAKTENQKEPEYDDDDEQEEEDEEEDEEEQAEQEDEDGEPIRSVRIRSHSLNPRYSKQNYFRRKSTSDTGTNMIQRLELSGGSQELEQINTPPPRRFSTIWSQRRFTFFGFDQQETKSNERRRMTTGRFSLFDEKPSSEMLKKKRPSTLTQMAESFARRFSIRKKKNNQESEQDETVVDPVYETLKIAAETRKMTLASYLQQRQQTLNKQTSLNSQGSSEIETQSSPRGSNLASRADTESNNSSLRPPSIKSRPLSIQQYQQSQSATPPLPAAAAAAAAAVPAATSSSIDNARVTNC